MGFDWLLDQLAVAALLEIGVKLVLLALATLIALRFARVTVRAALNRLFDREAREGTAQDVSAIELERRRDTLDGLIANSLRVVILIVAFVMALAIVRLDITPAIAGLGIAGLALSLGAQHLVRDYVAGAFVLIENQYSKGDVVSVAGVSGTVEDVSLRRTTLRDIDGTVHHVPHGLIAVSGNLTRSWARINLDLPVLYGQDLARIGQVVDEVGRTMAESAEWRGRILEPPRLVRIENLGDQGMLLKVLGTVRAVDRWDAAGETRRRLLETFELEGLHMGWRPPAPPVETPTSEESERTS
ncbi:MAG TPA: mechanosensitive ion channel family protein [Candidatus Limnocylindria bacterium]|nr:mechanosensitive ion channel family protein [Candidatus Limnocylindria bacterium]